MFWDTSGCPKKLEYNTSISAFFSRDLADDGLYSNFREHKILELTDMMISIAIAFPPWTPCAAVHFFLHLSNVP